MISLVPIGEVDKSALETLWKSLTEAFNQKTWVADGIKLTDKTYPQGSGMTDVSYTYDSSSNSNTPAFQLELVNITLDVMMLKKKPPQNSFYGSYIFDRIIPQDHLLR